MANPLEFPVLLRLINERAEVFRSAVASAPSLKAQVPTCPEWTLFDLVQHLGTSHRRWSATVAAGPADAAPADTAWPGPLTAPREQADLLAWSAASTAHLLKALSMSGPDRGCWTWWDRSESPQTSGGVARHQLQHVTVHTYDAQITGGAARPLPAEIALDGVEEFLTTSCAGTYPWRYGTKTVDYHATEGRAWRLSLSAAVVGITRLPAASTMPGGDAGKGTDTADVSLWGTDSDLVLNLYGRIPVDSLRLDGDRGVVDLLVDWDPDE